MSFPSDGDAWWLPAPVVQVDSITAESFQILERECCRWRTEKTFGFPLCVIRAWQTESQEAQKSEGAKQEQERWTRKMTIESGIHTYPLWAGTWIPLFFRKGFGGACLGHLDDFHRGDAFASHTVSGAQLVQSSLCHASPLLSII